MLAVNTSAGEGRYVPSPEWDAVFRTSRAGRPPLIWFHGNAQTAVTDYAGYFPALRLLAQRYTVITADLGGSTFGNDTGISRTASAAAYLASQWAAPGPVTLVGASMGASVALNYAVRNVSNVAAIAGIIPVVDLSVGGPAKASLDAAYPPAYDDNNATMRSHNPVRFAADLPASIPIKLWVSGNDTSVPNSTAEAFVAARPQTELVDFGDYGHGGVNEATVLVADWLEGL